MAKIKFYISPKKFAHDNWSYERTGEYISEKGKVIIYVCRWDTNSHPIIATWFKVKLRGKWYHEDWPYADFEDKTIQVKAARFLFKTFKQFELENALNSNP